MTGAEYIEYLISIDQMDDFDEFSEGLLEHYSDYPMDEYVITVHKTLFVNRTYEFYKILLVVNNLIRSVTVMYADSVPIAEADEFIHENMEENQAYKKLLTFIRGRAS